VSTLVLAILGDIVAPRERVRYTGYFTATFGTSSVLGPAGWRWVFLISMPIEIVALFVVSATLRIHHVPMPEVELRESPAAAAVAAARAEVLADPARSS